MGSFIACGPVVGIYLHARLGGIHLHGASAGGVSQFGGKAQFSLFFLVQHEIVVISGTVSDLLIIGIDVLADGFRCAEVEGSALHFENLSCGDGSLINRHIEIGIDFANLVLDGGRRIGNAREAEESVVGEVDDSLLVGGGQVFENQLVLVGKGKLNGHLALAREALFAVG